MKHTLIALLAALSFLAIPASAQSSRTLVHTQSYCGSTGISLPIPKFNPSLGTLVKIEVEAQAEYAFKLHASGSSGTGAWSLTAPASTNSANVTVSYGATALDSSGTQNYVANHSWGANCGQFGSSQLFTATGLSDGSTEHDEQTLLDEFLGSSGFVLITTSSSIATELVRVDPCDTLDAELTGEWCGGNQPPAKRWRTRLVWTYHYEV